MLSRSPIGVEAINDIALLDTVAKHKSFYYRSNTAKMEYKKCYHNLIDFELLHIMSERNN